MSVGVEFSCAKLFSEPRKVAGYSIIFSWKLAIFPFLTVNTMAADVLAPNVARASAAMALTYFALYITLRRGLSIWWHVLQARYVWTKCPLYQGQGHSESVTHCDLFVFIRIWNSMCGDILYAIIKWVSLGQRWCWAKRLCMTSDKHECRWWWDYIGDWGIETLTQQN